MKTCLLIFGLAFIAFVDACSYCFTKHPQQHFCDSHFAMKVKIIKEMKASDIEHTRQYKAKILTSWKKGPKEGKFKFYTPSTICGSTILKDRVYVITGTRELRDNGNGYLFHGSCDFIREWQDMSSQQKMGFRDDYAQQCGVCNISSMMMPSDMRVEDMRENDYQRAMTYWTPTGCFYNPHKTQQFTSRPGSKVTDCEDIYGVCAPNRHGECQWTVNAEYKTCFKYRDNFALVDSGDFAITEEWQCDVYENRRKRRKCRKQVRKYKAILGANQRVMRI